MTFALTNEYLWRKYWRKTMTSSSVHNTGPNVFIYNMILLKKCNVMLFIIENMKALRIVIFNISSWHNLNMLQILLLKELKIKKQNLLILLYWGWSNNARPRKGNCIGKITQVKYYFHFPLKVIKLWARIIFFQILVPSSWKWLPSVAGPWSCWMFWWPSDLAVPPPAPLSRQGFPWGDPSSWWHTSSGTPVAGSWRSLSLTQPLSSPTENKNKKQRISNTVLKAITL